MSPDTVDLYTQISDLRTTALDALSRLARSELALTSDEVSSLVVAMQRASYQLGNAQALLALRGFRDAAVEA